MSAWTCRSCGHTNSGTASGAQTGGRFSDFVDDLESAANTCARCGQARTGSAAPKPTPPLLRMIAGVFLLAVAALAVLLAVLEWGFATLIMLPTAAFAAALGLAIAGRGRRASALGWAAIFIGAQAVVLGRLLGKPTPMSRLLFGFVVLAVGVAIVFYVRRRRSASLKRGVASPE